MQKFLPLVALLLTGCSWQPPLYGHTTTSADLRGDVLALLKKDLFAQYHCTTVAVIDSALIQNTPTAVVEEWQVNACGQTYTYNVVLNPHVQLAPTRAGQAPTYGTAIQLVDRSATR